MIKALKKKYALSDQGAKDLLKGIVYSVLANISLMFPAILLAIVLNELLAPVLGASAPEISAAVYTVIGIEMCIRDRIKAVASYITEDLTAHHTIEQLSQKFEISTTALKKCFRGVYGTSVYSYLRTYRLQVAQKLLLETELSVTEIANKIGYENPNKFTSAFKETYGSSPTEFRKSVRLDRNESVWSGEEI